MAKDDILNLFVRQDGDEEETKEVEEVKDDNEETSEE